MPPQSKPIATLPVSAIHWLSIAYFTKNPIASTRMPMPILLVIFSPMKRSRSGFLPQERAWMDKFFSHGYVDTLREINQSPGLYTWWNQRFPSVRLSNKGWRIDYINVTENLRPAIKDARIFPEVQHSDHCPVYLELAI